MDYRSGEEPVLARVAATLDAAAQFLAPADWPRVEALRNRLASPLRVALIGRVNAGKSTLLNALVGQRVAPTNETECTRVATLYRFGAPARAEVVALDGSVTTIAIHGRLPDELGRPAAEIDHVVAHIPSGVLREYELVDTPGLATMNPTSSAATRRALIDSSVRGGIERPDVALFLTDGAPRADEMAFLHDMRASRVDTIALLSHADTFGDGPFGAVDPFAVAADHAHRLAQQLARSAGVFLPVSGLLAETALTGHFTEADARALGRLAAIDEFEIPAILGAGTDGDDGEADVARLLDLVGEYGIVHGRKRAEEGAAAMVQWLIEKSGLRAVHEEITNRFLHRGETLKARRALAELGALASGSPYEARIRGIVEDAQLDPDLHALRELAALELMVQWDPLHPLVSEFDRLTVGHTAATRLGLQAEADQAAIAEAAARQVRRCRSERLTALSAAEREAWTVLERSYQLMIRPRSERP